MKDISEEHGATMQHQQSGGFLVLRRIMDGLDWLCVLGAGAGLVFIVFSYSWMVYSRYILNNTPTWIGQLSLLLFIYVVCLGTAAGVYRNNHLSIEFVRDMFPKPIRMVAHALSDILVLAFGSIMAIEGWSLTLRNIDHRIPLLGITSSWKSAPLIICGILIVIFTLFKAFERMQKRNQERS